MVMLFPNLGFGFLDLCISNFEILDYGIWEFEFYDLGLLDFGC